MINSQDRDARGRFVPGNKGGPGAWSGKMGSFRQQLLEAVSPEELDEIIRVLLARARKGDLRAIVVLLDRLCGRPVQLVDHNTATESEMPALMTREEAEQILRESGYVKVASNAN